MKNNERKAKIIIKWKSMKIKEKNEIIINEEK